MLKVVIAGVTGRMGQELLEGVFADEGLQLHGAIDRADSPRIGHDAGEQFGRATGVKISADVGSALAGADVLIDFTRPEASMEYLAACERAGVKLVLGTTGFSAEQKAQIAATAQKIAVVFAPNMSVGVTLLIDLVQAAARVLAEAVRYGLAIGRSSGECARTRPAVLRGLRPRGGHRRTRCRYHRICHGTRRRCGRRPYGAVRRYR